MHLLDTESFTDTFGPKAQRKKPKFKVANIDDLAVTASSKLGNLIWLIIDDYQKDQDGDCLDNVAHDGVLEEAHDPIFDKGQSKRIWNELYKVIDSSDVILHVLDARDPIGTRCRNVESYMKGEVQHKHLIFVLNKCDLVPTWVTVSKYFFHLNHCYVKGLLYLSIVLCYNDGKI